MISIVRSGKKIFFFFARVTDTIAYSRGDVDDDFLLLIN